MGTVAADGAYGRTKRKDNAEALRAQSYAEEDGRGFTTEVAPAFAANGAATAGGQG